MRTNQFFDVRRFGMMCRRELLEPWKTHLLRFVACYAVLAVILVGYGIGDVQPFVAWHPLGIQSCFDAVFYGDFLCDGDAVCFFFYGADEDKDRPYCFSDNSGFGFREVSFALVAGDGGFYRCICNSVRACRPDESVGLQDVVQQCGRADNLCSLE